MARIDTIDNRYMKIIEVCKENKIELIEYSNLDDEYKNITVTFKCKCGNIETKSLSSFVRFPYCKKCCNNNCGNKKRFNIEKIKEEFSKRDCTLLSDSYQNAHQKLKYKCNKCDMEYKITWNNFNRVQSLCKNCFDAHKGCNKMSLDELKIKLKEMNMELYHENFEYESRIKTKLPLKCQRCGKLQYRTFAIVYRNKKCICEECETTRLLSLEEAQKIIMEKWNVKLLEYDGHKENCKYQCNCGHINNINYSTLYHHGPWCPYCMKTRSKGEEYVKELLINNNIYFEYEKTFENLKYIGKLKIDFYLPEYNIAIEIDGEHHRRPVYYGNKNNLEIVQTRDKIKDDYCVDNNIKMIRIIYDGNFVEDFKSRANEIINNILKRETK